jgi:hypothetical protein
MGKELRQGWGGNADVSSHCFVIRPGNGQKKSRTEKPGLSFEGQKTSRGEQPTRQNGRSTAPADVDIGPFSRRNNDEKCIAAMQGG